MYLVSILIFKKIKKQIKQKSNSNNLMAVKNCFSFRESIVYLHFVVVVIVVVVRLLLLVRTC